MEKLEKQLVSNDPKINWGIAHCLHCWKHHPENKCENCLFSGLNGSD